MLSYLQDKPEITGNLGGMKYSMKYQKITDIKIEEFKEKKWVLVKFENGTEWLPDLIDTGLIISLIGMCEDIKYPYGKGHLMTKEFIVDCFNKNYFQIKKLYKEKYDPNNKKVV